MHTRIALRRRLRIHGTATAFLMLAVLTAPVRASSVAIVNAGFEDNSVGVPFNEFTFGPPAGWSLHDPNGVTNGGAGPTYYLGTLTPFEADPIGNPGVYVNFPGGAAEGQRLGIAFNFAGSGGQGEYGIQQTLSTVLQSFTQYTLTVEIGNIASGTAMNGQFFNLDGFPGYRVEFRAGGVVLAQDNNTLAGSIPEGQWATSTVTFTTCATHPALGANMSIRLVNLNVVDPAFPGADIEVDFDDVQLDAVSTLSLADLNGDGSVNGADLAIVLGNWGTDGGATGADLNDDGIVNGADLAIVLGNWGGDC